MDRHAGQASANWRLQLAADVLAFDRQRRAGSADSFAALLLTAARRHDGLAWASVARDADTALLDLVSSVSASSWRPAWSIHGFCGFVRALTVTELAVF